MKRENIITLAAVVGLLVGTLCVYFYTRNDTRVEAPDLSPRSSDATASSEYLNAQKAVEFYREEIRKNPDVPKHYVELAQIYIQEARVTALHHEYFPKAAFLLDKALEIDPMDFNALITKASMLSTLHQFEQAKKLATKATSINPYNAFAYGVLCDTHVELGEYQQAVQACDRMLSIRPDLGSYCRASYLREIYGDNAGARLAMKMAGEAGVPGQENRAWAFFTLGKLYLNEGKLDTAEFIFKGILGERPEYAHALAGLAQVRFAQSRHEDAISLVKKAYAITPDHVFLEDLVTMHRAAGQNALAEEITGEVLKEFEDHGSEGWNVDKEFASFCANHNILLPEALQGAQRDLDRRPDNIDALDTYAWALYKNGRAREAVPFMERALRLQTSSALLKHHAGLIFYAAGDLEKARVYLDQALLINPYFSALTDDTSRKVLEQLRIVAVN